MTSARADEFAPGIPKARTIHPLPKVSAPSLWEFGIHSHAAERAGQHYDLRLGDPGTGHAHSWALRHLPNPGENRLAVQQPTHTIDYMDFKGHIGEGYGKGKVDLFRRDKAEVIKASEDHVRFNVYKGQNVEEYALRRSQPGSNKWLIQNLTTTREVGPGQHLPSSKPKYKLIPEHKLAVDDPNVELQAKIDGAHVLYQFRSPGSQPRVFSYRPTERTTGVIEHTQKLPDYHKLRSPGTLRDTILRGELYATDDSGRALSAARIGGLLNSNTLKSRQLQEQYGKLTPVVFDVVRWHGKDVENSSYETKKELLEKAVKAAPWLQLPRTATTPEEKRKLIEDIKQGKEPSTEEGVIQWHLDKSVPQKSKFLNEQDVIVRSIFPEAGAKRSGTMAGGFSFSYDPKGPIIGRVGTGMSHAMKKDMIENPDKYVGLTARVKVQKAPKHYAPRAPAFIGFHLDQPLPEGIKTAEEKEFKLQGSMQVQGLPIAVENKPGSVRSGIGKDGKPWRTEMKNHYGYIKGTKGADGEEVDVYVGPDKKAPDAYVVHQRKEDGKTYDEDKVMLGFKSKEEAREAFLKHYDSPKFLGPISTVSVEELKEKVDSGEVLKKISTALTQMFFMRG